jgi:hypothetical protein
MTGSTRQCDRGLSGVIALAARRRFCGLVVDGVDLETLLAEETDPRVLRQAFEIAESAGERFWAERFARRMYALDADPAAGLCLASILACVGRCGEAQAVLAAIPPGANEQLHRQVSGVLAAKGGRLDEAFGLFDTLPGHAPPDHPAAIVLPTLQEMIEQCDLAHATAVAERLAETYPAHVLIRSLNLRCQLLAGEWRKARALAQLPEPALEQAPVFERRMFVEAIAESLSLFGWMHELFDFARARIEKDPAHWSLYERAANAGRATSREREYAALIATIPGRAPDSVEAMAVLCRWRIDEAQAEDALQLIERIRPLSATLFLETRLYLSLYSRDEARIDAAFADCERCGISLPGPTIACAIHTYYYDCSADRVRKWLAKLETLGSSASKNAHYWQTYLRSLIALGEAQKAEDLYCALPPGLAGSAVLRPFHMFFDAAHGRHQEARKNWTRYITDTRHLCVNAPSSYPRTVRLNYAGSAGAVLLFVTLLDAMDYLDWFLAHYRALGVDHFFVIDNGSGDGSLEHLCAQQDVSVFQNRESFARSGFGVLWLNHLMQRFGVGHWCFQVDVDEGFVFPGYGQGRTLAELLSYCDRYGFGSVPAIELDMYPDRLDAHPGADPFEASCYFDTDYVMLPSELPPYVMIQGGIRKRLTGVAQSMQKSPLVRMARDVRYVECNHGTTHLPVADVSGALLHYKFAANTRSRIEQAIVRAEHFAGAISYRRLGSAVSSMGSTQSLLSIHSRRYEGPVSLLREGLIRSGPRWRCTDATPWRKTNIPAPRQVDRYLGGPLPFP